MRLMLGYRENRVSGLRIHNNRSSVAGCLICWCLDSCIHLSWLPGILKRLAQPQPFDVTPFKLPSNSIHTQSTCRSGMWLILPCRRIIRLPWTFDFLLLLFSLISPRLKKNTRQNENRKREKILDAFFGKLMVVGDSQKIKMVGT